MVKKETIDKKESKLYSRGDLLKIIEEKKKFGKKIVFTNGCFDILHIGHAIYLEEASKLGDILVVALNSDESIKLIKGDLRPVNSLEDRMLLLSYLYMVDYVTSFNETTAVDTIKLIKPDYYAKGGDVILDKVPEKSTVESYGGKIVLLSHIKGRSSTNIINKIKK